MATKSLQLPKRLGIVRRMKRNHSSKSPKELAAIFCEGLISADFVNGTAREIGSALFDASSRIDKIIPLPHAVADYDDISDELDDIISGGLLKIGGKAIKSAEALSLQKGFILVGETQVHDFSETVFRKDGYMDSCSGGCGRYVITVFGETLQSAYVAFQMECVKLTEKDIIKGLDKTAEVA